MYGVPAVRRAAFLLLTLFIAGCAVRAMPFFHAVASASDERYARRSAGPNPANPAAPA
jgi:hypothetical protein